jgi:hypothetical membrane protein
MMKQDQYNWYYIAILIYSSIGLLLIGIFSSTFLNSILNSTWFSDLRYC